MVAHMVQVVYYAVTWATFKPKIKNKKIRPEKKNYLRKWNFLPQ